MSNFRQIYDHLIEEKRGNQKKIHVDSCIEVFFGYNQAGNMRLSFLSKHDAPRMVSTKIIQVVQGREHQSVYWTSFDLLNPELKDAYYSFCDNMIDTVDSIKNEEAAMRLIKRRFSTWKALFQKENSNDISKDRLIGLFGELTVIKDILSPLYSINKAIYSWGGPDLQSKDFTISDTWYEVKTIGANTDSIHISSLAQLSSDIPGHLIVVRAEAVSPEYQGDNTSIIDLIKQILLSLSDEDVENEFIRKLHSQGIDVFGGEVSARFAVKSIIAYRVDEGFPRITEKDVPYPEIVKVTYTLSAGAISRFKEQ